ncbi:DUF4349 domain-containing protein [Paenibacillus sp. P26]|nr:DUF4349 domain-containing protein [Paenibacillus sp. P26]
MAFRGTAAVLLLTAWLAGCSAADGQNSGAASPQSAAKADMATANTAAPASSKEATQSGAAKGTTDTAAPSSGAGVTGKAAALEASDPYSRKIIYTARLTMQVDNYQQKQAEVQEAVRQSGGYILQFSEMSSASEKGGTMSIKVPASGFQPFLDRLERISPALQKNVQGQDVTEEYVDLDARLKAKQVAESRSLSFMEKATKTDELVAFSNELGKVQEEIERIKGRMRYLEQNVAYSTIELRISQIISSAEVIHAGTAAR